MENYEDFDLACGSLAHIVTDCDTLAVKSLIMAASSLVADSVVRDICKLVDRFTGCGFDFLINEVAIIHRYFFK